MKATLYSIILAGVGAICLSSCSAHEDYDAYVNDLKKQTAVIDTISSPASYAAYIDSIAVRLRRLSSLV